MFDLVCQVDIEQAVEMLRELRELSEMSESEREILSPEKFTLVLNTGKYGDCIIDDYNRYMANAEVMKNGKGVVALTYFFGTKVTKTLYFEDLKCVKVTYVDEWVPENTEKKEVEVENENLPF